jgi:hypothetical protein
MKIYAMATTRQLDCFPMADVAGMVPFYSRARIQVGCEGGVVLLPGGDMMGTCTCADGTQGISP